MQSLQKNILQKNLVPVWLHIKTQVKLIELHSLLGLLQPLSVPVGPIIEWRHYV